MVLKKLTKYALVTLTGVIGIAGICTTSLFYSESLTSFTLNTIKDKVPGLNWTSVSGSLANGVTFNDLRWTSPTYGYVKGVAKPQELNESNKAQVPTLVDVKINELKTSLSLSCLLKRNVCLKDSVVKGIKVAVATGNDEIIDNYNPDAYKNVNFQTILDSQIPKTDKESSGYPAWLYIDLDNTSIEDVEFILGKNIGLAQKAYNEKIVEKTTKKITNKSVNKNTQNPTSTKTIKDKKQIDSSNQYSTSHYKASLEDLRWSVIERYAPYQNKVIAGVFDKYLAPTMIVKAHKLVANKVGYGVNEDLQHKQTPQVTLQQVTLDQIAYYQAGDKSQQKLSQELDKATSDKNPNSLVNLIRNQTVEELTQQIEAKLNNQETALQIIGALNRALINGKKTFSLGTQEFYLVQQENSDQDKSNNPKQAIHTYKLFAQEQTKFVDNLIDSAKTISQKLIATSDQNEKEVKIDSQTNQQLELATLDLVKAQENTVLQQLKNIVENYFALEADSYSSSYKQLANLVINNSLKDLSSTTNNKQSKQAPSKREQIEEVKSFFDKQNQIFQTPIKEYYLNDINGLVLPVNIYSEEVAIDQVDLTFLEYNSQQVLTNLVVKQPAPQQTDVAQGVVDNLADVLDQQRAFLANLDSTTNSSTNNSTDKSTSQRKDSKNSKLTVQAWEKQLFSKRDTEVLDQFQIKSLNLNGELDSRESNVTLSAKGDLELNLTLNYQARTANLNSSLELKASRLPLVQLPFTLNTNIAVKGDAARQITLDISNQGQQLPIKGAFNFIANTANWPVDGYLYLDNYTITDNSNNSQNNSQSAKANSKSSIEFKPVLVRLYGRVGNLLAKTEGTLALKGYGSQDLNKNYVYRLTALQQDNKASFAFGLLEADNNLYTGFQQAVFHSIPNKLDAKKAAKAQIDAQTITPKLDDKEFQYLNQVAIGQEQNQTLANENNLALQLNANADLSSNIKLAVDAKINNLDLADFTDKQQFKSLKVNADLLAAGIYSSQKDWVFSLQPSKINGDINKSIYNISAALDLDSVNGLYLTDFQANYLSNVVYLYGYLAQQADLGLTAHINELKEVYPNLKVKLDSDIKASGDLFNLTVNGYIHLPYLKFNKETTSLNINNFTSKFKIDTLKQVGDKKLNKIEQRTPEPTTITSIMKERNSFFLTDTGPRYYVDFNASIDRSTIDKIVINKLDLNYKDQSKALTLDFNSSLAKVNLALKNIILKFPGDRFTLNRSIEQGLTENSHSVPYAVNGRTNQYIVGASLTINNLEIPSSKLSKIKTLTPLNALYFIDDQKAFVSPFSIASQDFKLDSKQTLSYSPTRVVGSLAVKQFNLSYLNKFLDSNTQRVYGTLDLNSTISFNPSNINSKNNLVDVTLSSSKISANTLVGYNSYDVSLLGFKANAKLQGSSLDLNLNTNVNESGKINIKAKIDDVQSFRNLDADIQIQKFNLAVIDPTHVRGYLNTNVSLKGTLDKPLLYGKTSIDQAIFVNENVPFDIKESSIVALFNGSSANLSGAIKTNTTPLNIKGSANWADLKNPNIRLVLSSQDLKLKVLQYGNVLLDSNLNANYADNKLVAGGNLVLHDGKFTIGEGQARKEYLTASDDVVFIDSKNPDKTSKKEEQTPSGNIDAKINLTIGDKVYFDAYGVNARLAGDLKIHYGEKIGLFGSVNIYDGTIVQYGQNLIIQRGVVSFNGIGYIPSINIRAIRNPEFMMDNNITVGINVTGTATKPVISLFSNPNMSESQQLNYLLTGSASTSSDGVGIQLLSSTLTSSLNFVNDIGKVVGIKNLQLSTAKSGDESQITLSGTLFDRIRVNYAYGLFNKLTEISASYKLLTDLYGRLTFGLTNAIDLVWTRQW